MTAAICPYCRAPIVSDEGNELVCSGCGTPHHADCYAENGGCTVFGCSSAPAEEPKLRVTGSDLVPPAPAVPSTSPTLGLPTAIPAPVPPQPPPPPVRVKAPPPPLPAGVAAPAAIPAAQFSTPGIGAGSVLFPHQPVPLPAYAAPTPTAFDFEPNPNAKYRMTFIILGVLLGPFGAHNFYAGYKGRAVAQLVITLLTLGLAGPMTWVWAVIDICTVNKDSQGIQFRS